MGAPFAFIAVQQGTGGIAVDTGRQFPRQIDHVSNSRTHALTHKGGHLVGRVTGEKEIAQQEHGIAEIQTAVSVDVRGVEPEIAALDARRADAGKDGSPVQAVLCQLQNRR